MCVCVCVTQQGEGSRAQGSDGNGGSIFRPPTLECRVRERHNTAIHSHITILSPVCEVDSPPLPSSSSPPGVCGKSLDGRVDMVSIKVQGQGCEARWRVLEKEGEDKS